MVLDHHRGTGIVDLDLFLRGLRLATAGAALGVASLRLAPRLLPSPDDDPADRALRALLLGLALAIASAALLGLVGQLAGWTVFATAVLVLLASLAVPYTRGSARGERRSRALWLPCAATALLLLVELLTFLAAPPADWDALTYHLFFPARWLQEGRLFHIPTVFGDNAAAFAPQNGALFFAWQMALLGRDATTNVAQLASLGMVALAVAGSSRELGATRQGAIAAALTVCWLAPLARWTFSADVDLVMLGFWSAAVYWTLAYLRRPAAGTLAAAALALGLAAGTKTIGLPLAALPAVVLLGVLAARRRFLAAAGLLLGATAGGGWWYLWNLVRYGNPLFPLHLAIGPLVLSGAYGVDAVRAGEFHAAGPGAALSILWRDFGPGVLALAVAGAAGLVALIHPRHPGALRRTLPAALAVTWSLYYLTFLPHNAQTRFFLPTLALTSVGWGYWVGKTRAWHRAAPVALTLLGFAAAALPALFERLGETLGTLAASGVNAGVWIAEAGLAIPAIMALGLLARRRGRWRSPAAGLALLGTAALLAGGAGHTATSRTTFWSRSAYGLWADAFLPFYAGAPPPFDIAYAGANIPYTLMGEGWRNRVFYVDVDGRGERSFYDFWKVERRRFAYHKPGLYRRREDPADWLDNLERRRPALLVLFTLHPVERRYLRSTAEGFPLEDLWARQRPERFELLRATPRARIYRLRPPSAAPDGGA